MKYLAGFLLIILSILMVVFTFMFWYKDDEAMVMLASLYVALFLSAIVGLIGMAILTSKRTTTIHVVDDDREDDDKDDL